MLDSCVIPKTISNGYSSPTGARSPSGSYAQQKSWVSVRLVSSSEEDRLALHRFKPDQSFQVGIGSGPVEAYLNGADIVRAAVESECDALHPGYGFLSENADFAELCEQHAINFIGPEAGVLRDLGNKVKARELAVKAGIAVMPASGPLPGDEKETEQIAGGIGFPLMLKASWGGGGRGMRIIRDFKGIHDTIKRARQEAQTSFGNDEVFFEKLVEDALHIEVQILGDHYGNVVHLYERDCSLQRRHQKVIERAPAIYLPQKVRAEICKAAVKLARKAGLNNAATVEFLYNKADKAFYFIEVNPRIQVEHTVTEEITGIDIVKAQIRIAEGEKIGKSGSMVRHNPPSGSWEPQFNAGLLLRTQTTTLSLITAISSPTGAPPDPESGLTAAPPIPAPGSPAPMTACW